MAKCEKCGKEFQFPSYLTKEIKGGGWTKRFTDPICPYCHEKLYERPEEY